MSVQTFYHYDKKLLRMNEKSKTFWKFTILYLASILLVGIAVFQNAKLSPKMKAASAISVEERLVNQQKLLFKVQKINEYLAELENLERRLSLIENDAREIGKIETQIDRNTLRLRSEIEKYRAESDGELYAEIFKNFDRLINLRMANDGLKIENLHTKEALNECKHASVSTLTLK